MRISDWSSDVCSSDLPPFARGTRRRWPPSARSNRRQRLSRPPAATKRLDAGDRSAPVGRDLLAGHGRSSAKPGGVPAAAALEIPPLQGRAPRPLNHMQEPEMNRIRSEEHKSELQSLIRISYAVFCLKKKIIHINNRRQNTNTQKTHDTT